MAAPGNMRSGELDVSSRVLIYGLKSAAGSEMNYNAGYIVKEQEAGRFGVQLLKGGKPVLIKRMNLLSASLRDDRELFLGLVTLNFSPGLRVARPALNNSLNEDVGLLLLIASFVTYPRECLFQFGGFMGKIWEENWCYSNVSRPIALKNQAAKRLDAACADLGLGRVLFAGGCGDHPRRCRFPDGFFRTAEIYDSLTDEWYAVSNMSSRRHGAVACRLGTKVYVLGGAYVDDGCRSPAEKFCDVFDIDSATWSPIPASHYDHVLDVDFDKAAFFGAGVANQRLVAFVEGVTIAYNPTSNDGWRKVDVCSNDEVIIGRSSCCEEYNGELVVASGRPLSCARVSAAFRFSSEPADDHWWTGSWRQLPTLAKARVGGSLSVVSGRLYITGGVDEDSGVFCDDAELLDGERWVSVPWFRMPRALHAHETFSLPHLHQSTLTVYSESGGGNMHRCELS